MKRTHFALGCIVAGILHIPFYYYYFGFKPLDWETRWVFMSTLIFGIGVGLFTSTSKGWIDE